MKFISVLNELIPQIYKEHSISIANQQHYLILLAIHLFKENSFNNQTILITNIIIIKQTIDFLMSFPSKHSKDKLEQYNRHKNYLKKIKHTSLYCPRYDMLSLNNNLLLHRNYDPKKELVPKKPSQELRNLEEEIKKKQAKTQKIEIKQQTKWYESVLRESQPTQKKFQFQYYPASTPAFSVREGLNKIYNTNRKGSIGKSKYGSFSSQLQ